MYYGYRKRVLFPLSFIGQFVHPVGGQGMGVIVILARYILLEYMIIWCKIHVFINPFEWMKKRQRNQDTIVDDFKKVKDSLQQICL